MKKILLTLVVIFLMGTSLVGCGDSNTPKSATVCVGSVAISGGLLWAGIVDVPFVLSALPSCIEFAYDAFAFSSPKTSPLAADVLSSFRSHAHTDDTPKVTLSDKYTYTSTASSKVYSVVLANCTPLQFNPTLEYQILYRLSVDSTMGVGEKNNVKIFTSKTSEISPFGSVNRTLFNQYGLTSQLEQTSNMNLSVPIHKKIALSVFATLSYKYGLARIDDNGTTAYLPWLFTTSSKPTARVQSDLQNC
jgi:hypothetical protein